MASKKPTPRGQIRRQNATGIAAEFLNRYLADFLSTAAHKDYCPNGLQVQGRPQIKRLGLAVSATVNAIEAATAWSADALLVHHGLYWKSDDPSLVGPLYQRVKRLIHAEMNLFAYHLPLDTHEQVGNNIALGRALGWLRAKPLDSSGFIWGVRLAKPIAAAALAQRVQTHLNREPILVGDLARKIQSIAWCTGGAQSYLRRAIELGADAFISGEISEQTTHLARETGRVFVAAGHHATERYGVQALGEALCLKFGIDVKFFDDPNPA